MNVRLESEALLLRPLTLADAPAIHDIVADPAVALMTAKIPHPYPNDGAADYIGWLLDNPTPGFVNLAIVREGDAHPIGMVAYKLERPTAELSYIVGRRWWGQGVGTQAAGMMVDHVFAACGVDSITGLVMSENKASARVLEKLGFAFVDQTELDLPARGGRYGIDRWLLGRAGHQAG